MKCEDSRELLNSYADGELDLVNHLRIAQHIKDCPDCARSYENILALRSAMTDESFYLKAPSDLRARLRSSRRSRPSSTVSRSRPP